MKLPALAGAGQATMAPATTSATAVGFRMGFPFFSVVAPAVSEGKGEPTRRDEPFASASGCGSGVAARDAVPRLPPASLDRRTTSL
jgi:hypothetical protein